MPINSDLYKQIGRSAAGAVSIIAGYDRTGVNIMALTVSSFVTLSYEPPLAMFAIQHNADSYTSMVESKAFGVSLLSIEQVDIAQRFARKGRDKAEAFIFDYGASHKIPLVPNAIAQIECRTDQVFLSGDHAIIVGLIEDARLRDGRPLLYYARQYGSFVPLTPV
jgi:flavin reductase ActVB